jgi:hypothetical protein
MRVHIDARMAVDVIERGGFGFSAVRIAGNATDDNPAKLVLLRRHADMADETPAAEARVDVERGAARVARIIDDVDPLRTGSDLTSVLEKAQEALKESGTYYSVLVAVITTSRVVAVGVGNVSMQLWRGDRSEPMLNPTTVVVGGTRVLSSALGLGYDRDQVQTADVSLGAEECILLGVDADLTVLHPMRGRQSATQLLEFVVDRVNVERSVIVGVITAAA